jgi:Icc-related predicted phosphoesterase
MRIWFLSDLHLEFATFRIPNPMPSADVCVVAGDVSNRSPAAAIEVLSEIARRMPVIYVAGNHDYYRGSITEGRKEGVLAAAAKGVHYLENEFVVIGDLKFLGSTLWTDMALHGTRETSMFEARAAMNDYKRIKFSKAPYRKLTPLHTVRAHIDSRAFLERNLLDLGARRTVVVTHHAPSMRSIPKSLQRDAASPAYASNMEAMIESAQPAMWIHGHVHRACDYMIGTTRVLCNPRGYPGRFADSILPWSLNYDPMV